eukprot:s777_g9.t1
MSWWEPNRKPSTVSASISLTNPKPSPTMLYNFDFNKQLLALKHQNEQLETLRIRVLPYLQSKMQQALTAFHPRVAWTMALPPHWERYTTDDGKEYFHNVSTNKTQWERPSWDEAPLSSLNTSDVFTYKPSAADLEVPRATASKNQELDDLFMGVATGPGTSELVSLKDARGDMSSSVSSTATSAPSASLPVQSQVAGLAAEHEKHLKSI